MACGSALELLRRTGEGSFACARHPHLYKTATARKQCEHGVWVQVEVEMWRRTGHALQQADVEAELVPLDGLFVGVSSVSALAMARAWDGTGKARAADSPCPQS